MSTAAKIAGSALITLLLIYVLIQEGGAEHVQTVLMGVSRSGLALYVLIAVSGIFFRAWRYRLILRLTLGTSAPSFTRMTVVTSIRNALADLLPARLGELSFFFVLSRYGIAAAHAAAPFGLSFILDLVVLFCVVAAAAVPAELLLSRTGNPAAPSLQWMQLGLVACSALVFASALLFNLRQLIRFALRVSASLSTRTGSDRSRDLLTRGQGFLRKLEGDLALIKGRRTWLMLFCLTFAIRVLKYGGLYILLVAVLKPVAASIGQITPLAAAAAFITAEASAGLPASGLMGFGTYEAAFALVFTVFGIEIPKIASVIFAVHVISQLTGYALGALGAIAFSLSRAEAAAPRPAQ